MLRVASVAAHSVRVTPRTAWTFARVVAEDGTQGWGEGMELAEIARADPGDS